MQDWKASQVGMFVYLDESGDTGFKFSKGSSRYFVVTILLTPDPVPLNSAIDDLRAELGFRREHEFKFYNSQDHVRHAFLRVLTKHDVLLRSLIVDKHQLTQPHMRKRETFYNYLLGLLLKHDNDRINDATLIIDQRDKGRKSKQGLATYLRKSLNTKANGYRKIKDVRYHESTGIICCKRLIWWRGRSKRSTKEGVPNTARSLVQKWTMNGT